MFKKGDRENDKSKKTGENCFRKIVLVRNIFMLFTFQ